MKKLKVLKIIIAIVMLIVICVNVYNAIVRMQEKERYKHTYIYELAQKISSNELTVKSVDDLETYTIIDLVLSENELWDKLPLSDNFKRKYKKSENIIKKYSSYEYISVGTVKESDKENTIDVYCTERDSLTSFMTGKSISTEYIFEYKIDSNNQLDDLILLKEVDIDSMTAETYAVREYNK